MRRIALLAGVITAIAAGTAAFAADTDPSPPGPAPDPLLGTWAVTVDGAYAGPVASVDGCSLTAEVITGPAGPNRVIPKHAGNPMPAPCSIEVGLGMAPSFHQWLSRALAGNAERHNLQLVRVDTKGYALDLPNTTLASVSLPRIDTASRAPAFLKVSLVSEALRRRPAPSLPKEAVTPARGFSPTMLNAQLDGVAVDLTSVGPWKAEIPQRSDTIGSERDYVREPEPTEIGTLPLRAPEARIATLDAWMQSQLVNGTTVDERTLVLTLGDARFGVELTLGHTGVIKGDLAPRADGSRAYALYAETVALTGR